MLKVLIYVILNKFFFKEPSTDESCGKEPSEKTPSVKEKESKRNLHNTSDHDYVETTTTTSTTTTTTTTPVPSNEGNVESDVVVKNSETDVFEFDEYKEGFEKIQILTKDSKMSYLKNNTSKVVVATAKKESDCNNQKNENLDDSTKDNVELDKNNSVKGQEKDFISVKPEKEDVTESTTTEKGLSPAAAAGKTIEEPKKIDAVPVEEENIEKKITPDLNNVNDSTSEIQNPPEEEKQVQEEQNQEEEKVITEKETTDYDMESQKKESEENNKKIKY